MDNLFEHYHSYGNHDFIISVNIVVMIDTTTGMKTDVKRNFLITSHLN